jgi:hypothetical protein
MGAVVLTFVATVGAVALAYLVAEWIQARHHGPARYYDPYDDDW